MRGVPHFPLFVLFIIVTAIVSCGICCIALVGCGIIRCVSNCNNERKLNPSSSFDDSESAYDLNAWPLTTESNMHRSIFTAFSHNFLPYFSQVDDDRSRLEYIIEDDELCSSKSQNSSACCVHQMLV